MRTIPAFLLCLFTPLWALAQPYQGPNPADQAVNQSPLFWYWVAVLVVAAAAFAVFSIRLSRRRGPPSRPRTM